MSTVEIIVSPFGIEADHPRNSDLYIQCVPGLRLRSRIQGTKTYTDQNGNTFLPVDQAMSLAQIPEVPGMQLHVNPVKLQYSIHDPLHGDEALCFKILQYMKKRGFSTTNKIDGVPPRSGTLDPHQMKSLVREMFNLVRANEAKVVGGRELPSMDEIDSLPGHYLLNPGSRIQNTQPRYEKDFEAWVERLNSSG